MDPARRQALWHGATATQQMSHVAYQEQRNGEVVTWLELVDDTNYPSDTNYHSK